MGFLDNEKAVQSMPYGRCFWGGDEPELFVST